MPEFKRSRAIGLFAMATATLFVATACSSEEPSDSQASASAEAVASAPADSATFAVIDNYAPIGFTDEDGNLTGFDPEIGKLIGEAMGIDLTVEAGAFESNMLGLQAGRVQYVSGASVTAERLETMDFVPYFKDAYSVAVMPDSPDIGDDLSDLCGSSYALVTGDAYVEKLQAYSDENCESPMEISTYPDGGAIQTAVKSGRIDGWICASVTCGYQAKEEPGSWKITGPRFGETTIGIASQKGSGWAEALLPALKQIAEDGTYQEVLDKYGVGEGALSPDEMVVNPEPDSGEL